MWIRTWCISVGARRTKDTGPIEACQEVCYSLITKFQTNRCITAHAGKLWSSIPRWSIVHSFCFLDFDKYGCRMMTMYLHHLYTREHERQSEMCKPTSDYDRLLYATVSWRLHSMGQCCRCWGTTRMWWSGLQEQVRVYLSISRSMCSICCRGPIFGCR